MNVRLNALSAARTLAVCVLGFGVALTAGGATAFAKKATPNDAVAKQKAKAAAPASTGTTKVAASADATVEAESEPSRWGASLLLETSVGIGSFVGGEQTNTSWATALQPTVRYKATDDITLSLTISGTFYHVNDYGTALPDGEFLLSDLSFNIGHGRIFKDDDSGFTLSGAFRIYAPTSKSSQLQNRLFTIRPSLNARLPVGPVTFSYTLGLAKYFGTTSTPTLNCDDFRDGQCRDGREAGPGPGGGFVSERNGGEVFLPSSGVSSFYVLNALSISWSIVEDLSLSVGATLYNTFGVQSFDTTELSSVAATEGRSQTDRLITSVGLSYQIIKQLSIGLSVDTDTVRPFGAQGDSFVTIFSNGTRASDNITSIALALTGSL